MISKVGGLSSPPKTALEPKRPPESLGLGGILGQEFVTSLLRKSIIQKRLHHAYLFDGPFGVGKATCAKALFAALNCEAPPVPGDACGSCRSCRKVIFQTHPDLIFVDMTLAGLAEEVERLLGRLTSSPYEGKAALVIFDPADAFAAPTAITAANRLLKTLEEPRQNIYFVLICQNAHVLLPTLRSRMQRIRFSPLPEALIQEAVISQGFAKGPLSESMLRFAQGSLGRVHEILANQEDWEQRMNCAQSLLEAAKEGSVKRIVTVCAQSEFSNREQAQRILEGILLLLYEDLSKNHSRTLLLSKIRVVQETMEAIRRFITPQFALERMLRRMKQSIESL